VVDLERQWLPQARRAMFADYRRQALSRWVTARGNSMRPLIHPGTWMLVAFGVPTVALGDIVLFQVGDTIVAHRAVALRRSQGQQVIVPKGDGEPYCDTAISIGDVIGVVRALRYGPEGPAISIGCAGFSARATARISRLSGRGASLARRVAALFPDPLRRVALRAIPPFARVAARSVFAPLRWAARIQIVRLQNHREEVNGR
jgi:hypothetical protein